MKQYSNYYQELGINSFNVGDEDIRRAYRALALRWHPDRNPGNRRAQQKFLLVSRAYAMLRTKPQRDAYNRYLRRRLPLKKEAAKLQKPSLLRRFSGLIIDVFWPFAFRQGASGG